MSTCMTVWSLVDVITLKRENTHERKNWFVTVESWWYEVEM